MFSILIFVFSLIIIDVQRGTSISVTFSYRTCLPNLNLIQIEHQQNANSERIELNLKDFRIEFRQIYLNKTSSFLFGSSPNEINARTYFSYQIDQWIYVNLTFDDQQSRLFLSLNDDPQRILPLMHYPWMISTNQTNEPSIIHVEILNDRNVSCLLPSQGFSSSSMRAESNFCSIDLKICEQRLCTSSSIKEEQYCPLFSLFDCHPFTEIQCAASSSSLILLPCTNQTCLNGGSCTIDSKETNNSRCICPLGFAGEQCQYVIDECQSNPCPRHSQCLDQSNGYKCVCEPGWTGRDCQEDIDECDLMKPCKAARKCTNQPGSYQCECLENFLGKNCEMTLDPCLSQPCLNNASKCHSILNPDHIRYHCTCQSGFTGQRCETNINDCEGIVCPKNNTQCVDGINSFHCECKENYKRNWDGTCVEQNPCDSSPCNPNSTCYNLNGGQYRCMCPPSSTGLRCDEDIDECTVFPFICRNGGTCVNEIGSYRCYCAAGWTGPTCAKAIDHCLSQPCHRNGTCINKINGYECRCLTAFTGPVCQYDIDECLIDPCLNNGTCFNYVGGFHCLCSSGYFGFHCEYPRSECERLQQASFALQCPNGENCLENSNDKFKQINQLSTYTCKTERDRVLDTYFTCLSEKDTPDYCHCPSNLLPCSDNYTETLGQSIRSKSSCPCRNGGTCVWLNSTTSRCYCPAGLTGETCLTPIDACASHPCYHNGTCLSQLNSFTCQCPSMYHGLVCQTYLDPCERNPCLNNGTCRKDKTEKTYRCECISTAFSGKHCEIYRNPCLSNPCQRGGTCWNDQDRFHCQCPLNSDGDHCEQTIDLCQTKNLCQNGGSCLMTNETIRCLCQPGFTGLFCETNIDECSSEPCSTHGRCLDLINGYQCHCQSGWYGNHCEKKQNDISKSFNYFTNAISVFHLRQSSLNISKSLPYRHSSLPIRIQYEFRTTLPSVQLLSIGTRFKQELIDKRILTNLDNKTILSSSIDDPNRWSMITVEIFHLWLDVRIGKNTFSQRFYVANTSLAELIDDQLLFGDEKNFTGCVRDIEISYSQAYTILLTDQLVETNENRTLGCERSNACDETKCRPNEFCEDHWFYHTCHCQRPFYGEQCDLIAPIIKFDKTSAANVTIASTISNVSLFFNTLESNGTLFEMFSSSKLDRYVRSNRIGPMKILGGLIDGRFRLIMIDGGPKQQDFELRSEQRLNDGHVHQIELDLTNYQLIIDRIHNETLRKFANPFVGNQIELLGDGELTGWFQDVRINDQLIPFENENDLNRQINVTSVNLNPSMINRCYPSNPCRNGGKCEVMIDEEYFCQCDSEWFGRNCSETNLCDFNGTNLCPDGFSCQVNGENQECLAVGTFEGNTSSLIATLIHNEVEKMSNELAFRLRARAQRAHLLTIKNLYTSHYFSLYLYDENLIYRDSILTTDLVIELNNETFDTWRNFHLFWSDFSTLTINHFYTYTINLSLKLLLTPTGQTQIFLGNGFRGCLENVRLGENLFLPFYQTDDERFHRRENRFLVEQLENIRINNCSFDEICSEIRCENGQCVEDFDRGQCQCDIGWHGDRCQLNINECEQGNECVETNGICEDQLEGFYTCRCHAGFTGQFCETNIDECASSPCFNRGTCVDLIDGFRCNCSEGFIDRFCSKSLDETCFGTKNSCLNNGQCELKSENLYVDRPESECRCRAGFSGLRCENDACSTLNCQQNGTCQRLIDGQAKCFCPNEWSGDRCENDVDECRINENISPCQNNATCHNEIGSFRCECPENYSGKFCEKKHICAMNSPCLNHGECRPKGDDYFCRCSTNFTGPICQYLTCESTPCQHNGTCFSDDERGFRCNCSGTGYDDERCTTEVNECLTNPCRNNGTCVDQVAAFTCLCPKTFFGNQCESKAFLSSIRFSYHYIVWPIVALFLLLLIILITIVLSRIREHRRLRGTYQPSLNENGQPSRVEFSMILKPPPEERLI